MHSKLVLIMYGQISGSNNPKAKPKLKTNVGNSVLRLFYATKYWFATISYSFYNLVIIIPYARSVKLA